MPRSFRGSFFDPKPDLLMVCRKIELRLIKGDNELPTVVFDGLELAKNSIERVSGSVFLRRREGVGNPAKMLHHKAK
jgi:hypothetical protein